MKFKKFIVSASAIVASSGVLATVLTSCSKADIDEDLKMNLDDNGLLFKGVDGLNELKDGLTFKQAVKTALSTSSSWATFKQALANELVYKWYENRASKDKNDTHKNTSFRSNLDEWKYQIDEDYNNTIDNLKSKYGANYKFYLQNEYLAANGGTEEAYKHAKLVEKVKTKFIDDAFATILFGVRDNAEASAYPHIFTKANSNISENDLNNPASWSKLGFYAQVDGSFAPESYETIDVEYLAEKPQGDYATLQDFVFNRWFATEKPFFSSAALFKYSNPNSTAEKKLTDIYNGSLATIPENPNEAFPFFGGQDSSESYKGELGFYKWYHALNDGEFHANDEYYVASDPNPHYNGTLTIGNQYSEDGQTLLLCSGKNMIGGTEGALYIPYGISAASLYLQMMGGAAAVPAVKNSILQSTLAANVGDTIPSYTDDSRILRNFFYDPNSKPDTITSFINLDKIYGAAYDPAGLYHCPIFKSNSNYSFLYGVPGDEGSGSDGVKFITNNVQVEIQPSDVSADQAQPWILELNEAGMHAQTIDGYAYVKNTQGDKQKALKEVIKYRLMQKKCGYNDKAISSDLFESKLKSYFTNNFADIVLEMALSNNSESNIFRTIESYKGNEDSNLFLEALTNEQKLGSFTDIEEYLGFIVTYDKEKTTYDAINTANAKIFAYRKDQITNSKDKAETHKKIFENGILAPLPIDYKTDGGSVRAIETHDYNTITPVIWNDFGATPKVAPTIESLNDSLEAISKCNFVKNASAESIAVNDGNSGFSPQVKAAKDVDSNRYWYQSAIVDKMMYGLMGSNNLANWIKQETYDGYGIKTFGDKDKQEAFNKLIENGMASTYVASKLLSGDKNFATYCNVPTQTSFFSIMNDAFENWKYQAEVNGGKHCDDLVNYKLYLATVAYLYKDNFANLYTALNNKIANDESAFVGYVSKYDTANATYADLAKSALMDSTKGAAVENAFYKWSANVDNIYDQAHYAGNVKGTETISDSRMSYDQYWHVVPQADNDQYAGFTGIQTNKSNQIDSTSGLQKAAFNELAKATQGSIPVGQTTGCVQNDGAFFAWAGSTDQAGQPYTFEEVKDPKTSETVGPENFVGFEVALKLARKIANSSTVQDLKDIAKSLGDAFYGYSIFKEIGYGTIKPTTTQPVDELKYMMLAELAKKDGSDAFAYAHTFKRLVKVELHSSASKYCFEGGSNGYKLLLTQINKSDITEKTIFPTYDGGQWKMKDGAGVTIDEFWYIFCSIATESSVQQLAIADAVKDIYGPDKLTVYDAQLYNQFDSVWIKDWVKKPIGGEGA